MPRPYHSPSSIGTGKRCQRAWAYCYIAGLRDPRVDWQESWAERLPEGVTPRVRSLSLGVAMHGVSERWFRHEPVDWTTYPAQVFISGTHLLPHPDRVGQALVEDAIGTLPHAVPVGSHAPPTALEVHGVRFAGYKDLVVHAPAELRRLRLAGSVALFDYKSTANIARYALTPAQLLEDVQCNLYALDTLDTCKLDTIAARWVYFETKRKRQAAAVDVTITRAHALRVLEPAAALARELDAIDTVEDATPNPDACEDYGGCQYHKSRGGPCNARRALGLSIARAYQERQNMAAGKLSPEMQARLDAARARATGGAAAPPDDGTPPTTEPPEDKADGGDDPPAPVVAGVTGTPPRRGRPAKAKGAAAPEGSLGATMHALADELTAAEALVADVRQRMAEALGAGA